jgi:hypothetical protein
VGRTVSESRSLERAVVVAVGVSWAWLFHERHDIPRFAWFMPTLFAVLGLIRAYGIHRFFEDVRVYMRTLESAFSAPGDPGGWEGSGRWRHWMRPSNVAFWGILIASTVFVAIYEVRLP